jgi:hypothetical protein
MCTIHALPFVDHSLNTQIINCTLRNKDAMLISLPHSNRQ